MSESFNPYVEWLGLAADQRPADHYQLLGIDRFQNDPAVISHAADVLTSRIRRVRPGQNLAAWQDLLDQLRQAKTCLLDPASKAAYDASLGGPSQPPPAEPAQTAPPVAQPPSGPAMALPPTSVWGAPQSSAPAPAPQPSSPTASQSSSPAAPQLSSPAAPQVAPAPGPYASPSLPGENLGWTPPSTPPSTPPANPPWSAPAPAASPNQGYGAPSPYYPGSPSPDSPSPVSPSPTAPWGGPSYPSQPAAGQGWNPTGPQPAAQGWNPAGPQPAAPQGWNPAGPQPAAPQSWNPAGPQPPAAQGWNPAGPQPAAGQGWNPAGPQPAAQGWNPAGPQPAAQGWNPAGPQPAPQGWNPAGPQPPAGQGWNPAGPQPASQGWNPAGPQPAAQGWNPAGPQPDAQAASMPGPYPAQQPYPAPNAWGNPPGAGGYLPAGQAAPAQGWGYPPVPTAQPAGYPPVPTAQPVGLPPTATVAETEYATAAPPAETQPDAAQASFIDDALMESIMPSTALPRTPVRQKSSLVRTLVNLLVLLAIVIAVVYGYKYYQKNFQEPHTIKSDLLVPPAPEAKPGAVKPVEKPKPDPGKKPDAKPGPLAQAKPVEKPKPDANKKPDAKPDPAKSAEKPKPDANKKPDAAGDPAKRQAFQRALAAARSALAQRETASLKRYLAIAAQNAQGPNDQAAVERVTLMGDYLEKYWEGIGRTMSRLVVAEEIIIGKAHLAVVESDASSITVHDEGQNKTFKVAELPRPLMHFMAERFLKSEPDAMVAYGVYLAISPQGDRDRARALLEEAAKKDSTVEKLLPELDEPPVPAGGVAATKSAPPEKAKLDQLLQSIRDKYKTDYDQATTPKGKGELAKILLDNGRACFDDMDQRFGMLAAARKEAIAAGDAALACETVDEMGKLHTIDVFNVKVKTLEDMGEAVRSLAVQRQIAEIAMTMANAALEANRLDEASRLARLAMSAALKTKNVPTTKKARALYLQIQNLRSQSHPARGE